MIEIKSSDGKMLSVCSFEHLLCRYKTAHLMLLCFICLHILRNTVNDNGIIV